MSMKQKFNEFYALFGESELANAMRNTRENSPYHREENVWVHTRMMLDFYWRNFSHNRSDYQQLLTTMAILFHDVGKPAAKIEKFTEARGNYFAFHGHEKMSARIFEQYFVEHPGFASEFHMSPMDLAKIRFMVEMHLPYDLTKSKKVREFDMACQLRLGEEGVRAFADLMLCDANGRISDDHAEKLEKTETWVKEFLARIEGVKAEIATEIVGNKANPKIKDKIAYILVGPSGAGKSTFASKLVDYGNISMDAYRLDFVHIICRERGEKVPDDPKARYGLAFKYSIEYKASFDKFMNTCANEDFRKHRVVVIDNVNATRKSRAQWIQKARQFGFEIVGVEFLSSPNFLIDRQDSRPDKKVPEEAVRKHFASIESLWIGSEVDHVDVVNTFAG